MTLPPALAFLARAHVDECVWYGEVTRGLGGAERLKSSVHDVLGGERHGWVLHDLYTLGIRGRGRERHTYQDALPAFKFRHGGTLTYSTASTVRCSDIPACWI